MSSSRALLLAGQAGLDFLNTRYVDLSSGEPIEVLKDGRAFVAWLVAAGLIDAAPKLRFTHQALDSAAAEARQLREWATQWVGRWRLAPGGDFRAEVERLNRLLGRVSYAKQLATTGTLVISERPRVETASDLVGLVAAPLAELVVGEAPELVKRCEGEGCVLWFVDRTKAHRRRFCSATACGNRAKVAAFRERERERR